MGPVEAGLPRLYVAVNDAVRAVRTREFWSMGYGSNEGELRFNRRLTELWLSRFDRPGIWPQLIASVIDPPDKNPSYTLDDLMSLIKKKDDEN